MNGWSRQAVVGSLASALLTGWALGAAEGWRNDEPGAAGVEGVGEAAARLARISEAGRAVLVGVASVEERRRAGEESAAALVRLGEGHAEGPGRALLRGRAMLVSSAATGRWSDAPAIEGWLRREDDLSTAAEALRRVSLANVLGRSSAGRGEAIELLDGVLELPVGVDTERSVPAEVMAEAIAARWLLRGEEADGPGGAALRTVLGSMALRAGEARMAGTEGLVGLAEEVIARQGLAAAGDEPSKIDRALEPLWQRMKDAGDAASRARAAGKIEGALWRIDEPAWPARARLAAGMARLSRGAREEGLRTLRALADEPRTSPWRDEARRTLAEELARSEDWSARLDGLARARALLAEDAKAPGNGPAARALLERSGEAWRTLRGDAERRAAARAEREAVLRLLIGRGVGGVGGAAWADGLRGELVALLVGDEKEGAATAEDLQSALVVSGAMGEGEAGRHAAAVLRAGFDRALGPEQPAAARAAAARVASVWAGAGEAGRANAYRRALAGALVELGEREGLAVYRSLRDAGALEARDELALGLGEAAMGEGTAAIETLQGLLKVVKPEQSTVYWPAWASFLELVTAADPRGERTGEVRLRLRQLRLVDPGLGGPATAARFSEIERRLK